MERVKNPNPQGKGVVPLLRDWEGVRPGVAAIKAPETVLRDYCISSLVLAARFHFKPVIGKDYYLYARGRDWTMSLIGPLEWGQREPGAFLGRCRLRQDMTWEIDVSAESGAHAAAMEKAQEFVAGFVESLAERGAIDEDLPFFVRELPYYQRLLATALATSLQRSLPPDGGDEIVKLLRAPREWMLAGKAATTATG